MRASKELPEEWIDQQLIVSFPSRDQHNYLHDSMVAAIGALL